MASHDGKPLAAVRHWWGQRPPHRRVALIFAGVIVPMTVWPLADYIITTPWYRRYGLYDDSSIWALALAGLTIGGAFAIFGLMQNADPPRHEPPPTVG